MADVPAISVIIPVFNRRHCLAATLRSVLAQTFTDFEVIVVDDGSTDDSAAVARGFGDRVRVLSQPNRGASAARNAGLRAARGKWIAFLDSDDFWSPQKLERQLAVLQKHGGNWCAAQPVDENGRRLFRLEEVNATRLEPGIFIIPQPVEVVLAAACHPYLQSMLVEKSLAQRAGGFDEELGNAEDTEFIFRLARLSTLLFVDEPLAVVTQSSADSLMRNPDPQARARRYGHLLRAQEKIDAALPADSPLKKKSLALTGYFLQLRAELACLVGEWPLARRLASRGMRLRGNLRIRLRCAAIWCWPGALAPGLKKKWADPQPPA